MEWQNSKMPDSLDSQRLHTILRTVEQGRGKYDTRRLDILVSARVGNSANVGHELLDLETLGLLARIEDPKAVGRWILTSEGSAKLTEMEEPEG